MKIFYTASYSGKKTYQKYYDLLLAAIIKTGAKVISPELGNYMDLLDDKTKESSVDHKDLHYKAIKSGIVWADLVLIEVSKEDFQLGHEATLTIQNRKPVLCLSIHEDFALKIKNKFFYGAKYNRHNVERIVREFVEQHSKELLSERFNMFLSKKQIKFLENRSEQYGMNQSEYIRKLINEAARKD